MAEGDAQRKALTYCTETLSLYFRSRRSDVYVAGNLFIYYEQGNPASVIAPDVFVVFGVNSDDRRSYKTWEEGDRTPDFVLEITSKSTRTQDQGAKKGIYAFLGVQEYFQFDPTGDYLQPALQGMRLQDGNYSVIQPKETAENLLILHSESLQLDLRLEAGQLRFSNPATGEKLLSYEELEEARQAAEQRANDEAIARQAIEARMAELEAQLRQLKGES
ncbi:MAG: Uma2 family endonuclease [Leptolyngbyaceae cyanobacterium SM1_3_5]|nr:Uma2 family endonuclease [Leptolyngbyaceae cyanobacterium SM1_3_5]